jgi:hypothetical protein
VGLFVGYAFGKYRGTTEASAGVSPIKKPPAEPPVQSSEPAGDSDVTVYIRQGGNHYHRESCHHVRRRKSQSMTKGEALKKGYRRCPHCRP